MKVLLNKKAAILAAPILRYRLASDRKAVENLKKLAQSTSSLYIFSIHSGFYISSIFLFFPIILLF